MTITIEGMELKEKYSVSSYKSLRRDEGRKRAKSRDFFLSFSIFLPLREFIVGFSNLLTLSFLLGGRHARSFKREPNVYGTSDNVFFFLIVKCGHYHGCP